MKTISLVILILIAVVLVDHFDLMKPNDRYPDAVNKLIGLVIDEPIQAPPTEPQPAVITPKQNQKLYQWKSDDGVLQITDTPPEDRPYSTLDLSENVDTTTNIDPYLSEDDTPLTKQELIQASRCHYYLEQVDKYKNKLRFGAPGHIENHYQQQIETNQRLALQHCSTID